MLFALTVSLMIYAPAAGAVVDDCRECSPKGAVERAEKLVNALRPRLPRETTVPGIFGLLGAHERRLRGDLDGARTLLLHASAACFGGEDASCGDEYAALAEVTALKSGGKDPLAEGFLSLVDTARVPSAVCREVVELRFVLKARARPWTAKSSWADACGPGVGGALAYHAARTAILRGDPQRSERACQTSAPPRARPNAARRLSAGRHRRTPREVKARGRKVRSARVARSERDAERSRGRRTQPRCAPTRAPQARAWGTGGGAAVVPARRRADARTTGRAHGGGRRAAHIGQLGTAARYLDALDAHYPDAGSAVDRQRIRANLQALRGDEGDARATFASLSNSGRAMRAKIGGKAQVLSLLREDPSLNGLIDPALAQGFFVLEDELGTVSRELENLQAQIASLDVGARETAELRDLKRADAYLARAERDIGIADVQTQIRAAELRAVIDEMVTRTTTIETTLQHRRTRAHREIAEELAVAESDLLEVKAQATEQMAGLSERLYARALEVVEGLEMSEDIGAIEMAWQRKLKVSAEARRIREEYDEGLATLRGDTGVTSIAELHKDDEIEDIPDDEPEEPNELSGPNQGLEKGPQGGRAEEGSEAAAEGGT